MNSDRYRDRYRRDGTPYPPGEEGLMEWARDAADLEKKIVRRDKLPNGYLVSTVWLGLNHRFRAGPPLIFETMVFLDDGLGMADDYQERYTTEAEAVLGHQRAVEFYRNNKPAIVKEE
jgi:hypothetical protein